VTNAEIAALLAEMAVLLEVEGGNPFRVRAYQRGSLAIGGLPKPVAEYSEKELLAVPGIGKGIAEHLRDITRTGTFADLARLKKKFPAGLLELLRCPGLGPKRARFLFDEAGIKDLASLEKALKGGKLAGLRGFGAKTAENLAKSLAFASAPQRLLHFEALQTAEEILAVLRARPEALRAEFAGSLRRGCETVGDVDVLCASKNAAPLIAAFTKLPRVQTILASGPTKASVRLIGGLQVDLRVVAPASFGAALQYFTGSKDHNVALRELALKKGLTINEYGVFKLADKEHKRPLAGETEESVYAALGLPWIPPEIRENQGEIQAAIAGTLPRLVELKDVRGDFHNHTTHTDGRHSMLEMAQAAKKQGWEWCAIGDHSKSLTVARGLDVERLRQSFRELAEVRKKVKGIALMRSMEVDILEDGGMDYADDVLDEIDVVVGSVHSRFKMEGPEMTRRIAKALRNPRVDVLGHLSGRLINRRPAYAFDAETVLKAAAEGRTALEINGQPDRQDLDAPRARRAKALGAPLAVSTDAHSISEFGHMRMAVTIARRAWLEPKDLINCMSVKELGSWLEERHACAR
jgi:DNA polymerase (family X)